MSEQPTPAHEQSVKDQPQKRYIDLTLEERVYRLEQTVQTLAKITKDLAMYQGHTLAPILLSGHTTQTLMELADEVARATVPVPPRDEWASYCACG